MTLTCHKLKSRPLAALAAAVWLCCMVLAAGLAMAAAPKAPKADADAHGTPAEGEAAESGSDAHGTPDAAPQEVPKVYTLAEPLGGKFDISTLRVSRKTSALRYTLGMITSSVPAGGSRNMRVSVNLVLEFGSETGMAEAEVRNDEVVDMIRKLLARFTVEELETPEGKLRLKDTVALNLNRRFKTAHVRKVYYMMFHIAPNS